MEFFWDPQHKRVSRGRGGEGVAAVSPEKYIGRREETTGENRANCRCPPENKSSGVRSAAAETKPSGAERFIMVKEAVKGDTEEGDSLAAGHGAARSAERRNVRSDLLVRAPSRGLQRSLQMSPETIGTGSSGNAPDCGTCLEAIRPPYFGEPGSIPAGVAPGFLHVGIVPDDAAGRRVFLGISCFPRPCIPALFHTYLTAPSPVQDLDVKNHGEEISALLKALMVIAPDTLLMPTAALIVLWFRATRNANATEYISTEAKCSCASFCVGVPILVVESKLLPNELAKFSGVYSSVGTVIFREKIGPQSRLQYYIYTSAVGITPLAAGAASTFDSTTQDSVTSTLNRRDWCADSLHEPEHISANKKSYTILQCFELYLVSIDSTILQISEHSPRFSLAAAPTCLISLKEARHSTAKLILLDEEFSEAYQTHFLPVAGVGQTHSNLEFSLSSNNNANFAGLYSSVIHCNTHLHFPVGAFGDDGKARPRVVTDRASRRVHLRPATSRNTQATRVRGFPAIPTLHMYIYYTCTLRRTSYVVASVPLYPRSCICTSFTFKLAREYSTVQRWNIRLSRELQLHMPPRWRHWLATCGNRKVPASPRALNAATEYSLNNERCLPPCEGLLLLDIVFCYVHLTSISSLPVQRPIYITPCDMGFAKRLVKIRGVAVAERLVCSPSTKATRVQSPARPLPDFHICKSCRTMSLVGIFSRGSPVSPHPFIPALLNITSITLIGSRYLAVKSRPDIFTRSLMTSCCWVVAAGSAVHAPLRGTPPPLWLTHSSSQARARSSARRSSQVQDSNCSVLVNGEASTEVLPFMMKIRHRPPLPRSSRATAIKAKTVVNLQKRYVVPPPPHNVKGKGVEEWLEIPLKHLDGDKEVVLLGISLINSLRNNGSPPLSAQTQSACWRHFPKPQDGPLVNRRHLRFHPLAKKLSLSSPYKAWETLLGLRPTSRQWGVGTWNGQLFLRQTCDAERFAVQTAEEELDNTLPPPFPVTSSRHSCPVLVADRPDVTDHSRETAEEELDNTLPPPFPVTSSRHSCPVLVADRPDLTDHSRETAEEELDNTLPPPFPVTSSRHSCPVRVADRPDVTDHSRETAEEELDNTLPPPFPVTSSRHSCPVRVADRPDVTDHSREVDKTYVGSLERRGDFSQRVLPLTPGDSRRGGKERSSGRRSSCRVDGGSRGRGEVLGMEETETVSEMPEFVDKMIIFDGATQRVIARWRDAYKSSRLAEVAVKNAVIAVFDRAWWLRCNRYAGQVRIETYEMTNFRITNLSFRTRLHCFRCYITRTCSDTSKQVRTPVAQSVGAPPVWVAGGSGIKSRRMYKYADISCTWLSAVTVEDDDWASVLQEASNTWLDYSSPVKANWALSPARIVPGFSHVGIIVPDDAAGRPVFSGLTPPPGPFFSALLRTHLTSSASALKTSVLRGAQISPLSAPSKMPKMWIHSLFGHLGPAGEFRANGKHWGKRRHNHGLSLWQQPTNEMRILALLEKRTSSLAYGSLNLRIFLIFTYWLKCFQGIQPTSSAQLGGNKAMFTTAVWRQARLLARAICICPCRLRDNALRSVIIGTRIMIAYVSPLPERVIARRPGKSLR
ncbi:hypothetical protein PR048_003287 [Dryococelus australis]|uniref:Uncharacterized protein n=1 Tax=Dryococelus australis TaxID=614101 RepID=A0ABQ9IMP9_9NEOP|nr:hypothetical protein PR048_003287 [Dryococelus australis]